MIRVLQGKIIKIYYLHTGVSRGIVEVYVSNIEQLDFDLFNDNR